MSRIIADAIRLAKSPMKPLRFHQTIARKGYDDGGAAVHTGEPETIPERPETIAAQAKQLAAGKRACVFVARGSKAGHFPAGVHSIPTHDGRIYFNPKMISREQVIELAGSGRLNELLGYVQSKPEAFRRSLEQGVLPQTVVSRDADGIEQDAAVVSPDMAHHQAKIFEDRACGGSTISHEGIEDGVLRDRVSHGGVPEEVY